MVDMFVKRILYVFTGGRKKRMDLCVPQEVPGDFFYGYPYLRAHGYDVAMLETTEPLPLPRTVACRVLEWISRVCVRWYGVGSRAHVLLQSLAALRQYDVIVAVPDSNALGVALLKMFHRLRGRLVYIAMGIAAGLHRLKCTRPVMYPVAKICMGFLFRQCARIVVVGKGEYVFLTREFASIKERFSFVPFGVDTTFWRPAAVPVERKHILFVGNDANRNFDLVCTIARELRQYHFLVVSDRIKESQVSANVTLRRGNWVSAPLSDGAMRELYHASRCVILPLHDSLQPSGQSVALQAMACGIPVLISRTQGFWDPERCLHGEHLYLVDGNDAASWAHAILDILGNECAQTRLSEEGRILVEREYTQDIFAEQLQRIIDLQS